jgi:hypothetical protein
MAFALVRNTAEVVSGSPVVVTIVASGVGNLIVVHFWGDANAVVTGVVDNVGNSYEIGSGVIFTTQLAIYQIYGVQVTGGATSITVTYTNSGGKVQVDEFSGGEPTNALIYDTRQSNTGTGTNLSVPTLTPAATGELMVATGGSGSGRTWTAGTNYTLNNGTTALRLKGQYRLSSASTETAPMSIDLSVDWAEIAHAYKLYNPAPSITSFTPSIAKQGDTVTITGRNFTGATVVSFGGTNASSFNVVSDTTITAVVAAGTSGDVLVTTPDGTDSLAGFTFYIPSIITNIQTIYDIQTIKFN